MKNTAKLLLASTALVAVISCGGSGGGGGGNSGASKLNYTNPTSGDFRLEATSGTGTGTITLALKGPSNVRARGANFGFTADSAKAKFLNQGGNNYAANGSVFDLGNAPRIFKAVLDGSSVKVSMGQKGNAVGAKSLDGTIATVQLQIQSGAQAGAVSLSALPATVLLENGTEQTVTVSVGALEAQ